MKSRTQGALQFIMFLLLSFSYSLYSQGQPLEQSTFTALRGTWEFHTYEERWLLNFISDHTVLMNNEPSSYTVDGTVISIQADNKQIPSSAELIGDKLVMVLPDGKDIRLQHKKTGDTEQLLKGSFYPYEDAPSEQSASYSSPSFVFDGQQQFSITLPVVPDSSSDNNQQTEFQTLNGTYRVEGDQVILLYDDQTFDVAAVRFRDQNNQIQGILFNHKLFETEATEKYSPIVENIPPIIPGDPGGCPEPGPPSPRPYPYPQPPIADGPPIGQNPGPSVDAQTNHHRTFGYTRSEQPSASLGRGTTTPQPQEANNTSRTFGEKRGDRP